MLLTPEAEKNRITVSNSINVNGYSLEKFIKVLLYTKDMDPGSSINIPITIEGKGDKFITFTIEVNFKYNENSSTMNCTHNANINNGNTEEKDFITINIFNAHLYNTQGYIGIDEMVKLYDLVDEVNSASIYLKWLFSLSPGSDGSRFGDFAVFIYSKDYKE